MVKGEEKNSSYLETTNEMRCLGCKQYCRGQQFRETASEKLLAEAPSKGQTGKGIKAQGAAVLIRHRVGNQYGDGYGICRSSRSRKYLKTPDL